MEATKEVARLEKEADIRSRVSVLELRLSGSVGLIIQIAESNPDLAMGMMHKTLPAILGVVKSAGAFKLSIPSRQLGLGRGLNTAHSSPVYQCLQMMAACPEQLLDFSDQVAQALWQVSVYKSRLVESILSFFRKTALVKTTLVCCFLCSISVPAYSLPFYFQAPLSLSPSSQQTKPDFHRT
jgi:hypothetical protein